MVRLLTAGEAAKCLEISRPSVLKLVEMGELAPSAILNDRWPLFDPIKLQEAKAKLSIKPRRKRDKKSAA